MGTRNLTAVYLDGEYKVAQYGQWDGYPEGQGMTCLTFLRDKMNTDKFKAALRKCSWIDRAELSALYRQYGADEHGMISMDDADRMASDYPELSRDTGAEILDLIQNSNGMRLDNAITFAADGLFCEWAWVIDFDKGTFEAYTGFRNDPLTESDRFYFLKDQEENGYSGVHMVVSWPLDALPTKDEFLAAFPEDE